MNALDVTFGTISGATAPTVQPCTYCATPMPFINNPIIRYDELNSLAGLRENFDSLNGCYYLDPKLLLLFVIIVIIVITATIVIKKN